MKNIRIGKDITVRWPILTNTKPLTLAGRDLTLFIKSPDSSGAPTLFECEANVAVFHIRGVSQLHVGAYSFTLFENYGKIGQTAVDYCEAFRLVSSTCKEDLVAPAGNLTIETVNLESSILELGVQGDKGLSAYEVEVKNGFIGTEAEWLKSLHADADKVAADLLLETKTRVAADQELAAATEQKMNAKDAATLIAAKEFTTAADTTTLREAKAFTTSEIAKIPTPDVSGQIATHNSAINSHADIRELVARKVEKEAGKGLSAHDFTALLKTKLEGLNNYDDATIRAAVASVQTQLNTLLNGNVNGVIDAFNEIEKFLAGITDAQTLTGLLADLRREVVALIPTKTSQLTNDAKFLTSEVDPTVPAWAKNPTKPVYTASEVGAEPVQVVETITAATSTLNVIGGHTYLCGEMTSLTLATVENAPREAVIRFASGAAATTLSLPATLKVVGYAKPAANQSYEISIRQGAAVIVNF